MGFPYPWAASWPWREAPSTTSSCAAAPGRDIRRHAPAGRGPRRRDARFAVDRSPGVTTDHTVVLIGPKGQAHPARLRRVRSQDTATGIRSGLWTHGFHVAATPLMAIYQQPWLSELSSKAMRQHLRIKTSRGTAENAVMTQGGWR